MTEKKKERRKEGRKSTNDGQIGNLACTNITGPELPQHCLSIVGKKSGYPLAFVQILRVFGNFWETEGIRSKKYIAKGIQMRTKLNSHSKPSNLLRVFGSDRAEGVIN